MFCRFGLVDDRRPVEDIVFSDADYRRLYDGAGLTLTETHEPLAGPADPGEWVSETEIAPWAIYVLAPDAAGEPGRHSDSSDAGD